MVTLLTDLNYATIACCFHELLFYNISGMTSPYAFLFQLHLFSLFRG